MSAPRDADLSALREALAATLDNLRGPLEDTTKARAANWLNDQGDALLAALALPRETAAAPALDIDELAAAIRVEGESGRWGDEESHTFRFMNETLAGLLIETVRAARLSASGATE